MTRREARLRVGNGSIRAGLILTVGILCLLMFT
jgi:hypothetical protein